MDQIRQQQTHKGFTLVELLIIIAIITVIAAILILILNPVEYIRRGRDAQRLRDYTLINQSVNFYAYGTSLRSGNPDYDGPGYTDTCKGETTPTLYVSVPSDNGEDDPDPPSGWTYNRVAASPLRVINGNGWLPIDFTSLDETIRPLSILPVDPINTFNEGFYYTYTCGSFELNLRFETAKYNELAANDGGDDPNVYEIGSILTHSPTQDVYTEGGTRNMSAGAPSGTIVLYPNSTYSNSGWTITGAGSAWEAIDDPQGSPDTADYIRANATNLPINFELTTSGSISGSATITEIRMFATHKQGFANERFVPRLRNCTVTCGAYVNGSTTLASIGSWSNEDHVATWDNGTLGLLPSDVNELQAGLLSDDNGDGWGASVDIAQLYIEIDYQ